MPIVVHLFMNTHLNLRLDIGSTSVLPSSSVVSSFSSGVPQSSPRSSLHPPAHCPPAPLRERLHPSSVDGGVKSLPKILLIAGPFVVIVSSSVIVKVGMSTIVSFALLVAFDATAAPAPRTYSKYMVVGSFVLAASNRG